MGDLGVDTTMNIIENLQERVKEEKIKEPSECRQLLIDIIKEQMKPWTRRLMSTRTGPPWCW